MGTLQLSERRDWRRQLELAALRELSRSAAQSGAVAAPIRDLENRRRLL
jgi:hypothetical protein